MNTETVRQKLRKKWREAEKEIQAHLKRAKSNSLGDCSECHQNVGLQSGLNYAIKLLGGRELK